MRMITIHHPGHVLKAMLYDAKVSVTDAAERLGVTRQALNNIVNGKAGISPEMAIRLSKGFPDTEPRWWMEKQLHFDLWKVAQTERVKKLNIKRLVAK